MHALRRRRRDRLRDRHRCQSDDDHLHGRGPDRAGLEARAIDSRSSDRHRTVLANGGDDITELYLQLLRRVGFQYAQADLNNDRDWALVQDLKERSVSFSEVRSASPGQC